MVGVGHDEVQGRVRLRQLIRVGLRDDERLLGHVAAHLHADGQRCSCRGSDELELRLLLRLQPRRLPDRVAPVRTDTNGPVSGRGRSAVRGPKTSVCRLESAGCSRTYERFASHHSRSRCFASSCPSGPSSRRTSSMCL
ncbi:hypothetical protein ACFPRL_16505 [Pseudoclavibacter helvolus]